MDTIFIEDLELEALVDNMQKLKDQNNIVADAYERSRQEIVKYLDDHNLKSVYTTVNGKTFKATLVRPEVITVDEKVLIKAIGRRLFNKATERKLNKKLLYDLVTQGVIDGEIVAKASYLSTNKAYPSVTEVPVDQVLYESD